MTMASLDDVSVGCGGCNSKYHSTRVCLGLPDMMVLSYRRYDRI